MAKAASDAAPANEDLKAKFTAAQTAAVGELQREVTQLRRSHSSVADLHRQVSDVEELRREVAMLRDAAPGGGVAAQSAVSEMRSEIALLLVRHPFSTYNAFSFSEACLSVLGGCVRNKEPVGFLVSRHQHRVAATL